MMSEHVEQNLPSHDPLPQKHEDHSTDIAEYQQWQHDQIDINALLSTRAINTDNELSPLELSLQGREPEFFTRNCIPVDRNLWKLERYDDFIAARQQLINDRFKDVMRYLDEAEKGVRFD